MTRRIALATAAAVALGAAAVVLAPSATAAFTDVETAALPVSSATLGAPTALTLSKTCGFLSGTLAASWTAAADTHVTGYTVVVSSALSSNTTNVTGRTTTSVTGIAMIPLVTYTVTVRSVYKNWTSTAITATAAC